MNRMNRLALYIFAALLAVGLTAAVVLAQDAVQTATPLEKAVNAVGGAEALVGLETFSTESTGVRWVLDEGFVPGGDPVRIGAYTATVQIDAVNGNIHIAQTRETLGQPRDLIEVVAGEVGYMDGQDGRFGQPTQQAMRSDRFISTIKQQMLLNPHLILQELVDDPSQVVDAGEVLHDGAVYHRLQVEGGSAPLTLYVHAGTGALAKITTTEEMPLRRDVELAVYYYGWQPIGESGVAFPAEIYIALDGEIVVKEMRAAIAVNPELAADLFTIPDGIEFTADDELAARGAANHQYLQMFAHYGFIRDGIQTNLAANELAPGIYHITGGSHHSLAVEQEDGIVIIEAPLGGYRSNLIMDWAAETFPNKSITHAVATHHHEDHAAGLRQFAAAGATAVVHELAEDFFAHIFDAPATISPDMMAENMAGYEMDSVSADDTLEIDDDAHAVEIIPIAQTHAEDMIIAYVADPGIVFVSDLYSPNPDADSAGGGGQIVADAIAAHGLDVAWIVGGHGGAISWEDFQAQLD